MKIWLNTPTLDQVNAMNPNTLMESLGIEITEVNSDNIVGTMPVDSRTLQPMGLLHGGASIALAETLGSIASHLIIDTKAESTVGLSVSSNHLKSAKNGFVTGTATPIHIGRSTHIWNIEIKNEANQLVNVTTLTMAVKTLTN